MDVTTFRHEALFYAGEEEFLAGTSAFLREGVRQGEPVLVVLSAPKIDLLRARLGADADGAQFADMAEVGRNPARIIPAWRRFVTEYGTNGSRLRGIGEPIWAARTPDELVECERHESLLNLAFDGRPAWWLLCPYDTNTLTDAVLEEARRNHPFLQTLRSHRSSTVYRGLDAIDQPFDQPLPEPEHPTEAMFFGSGDLPDVRSFVGQRAFNWGLSPERTEDIVLAVNELATNSLRYGGGAGVVRMWRNGTTLLCEVADGGRITDPLVGRATPSMARERGFGLWLVNHLCDLVQVRTFDTGSVVRLHLSLREPALV